MNADVIKRLLEQHRDGDDEEEEDLVVLRAAHDAFVLSTWVERTLLERCVRAVPILKGNLEMARFPLPARSGDLIISDDLAENI
jgi:hypothetical protein